MVNVQDRDESFWAPGTVALEDISRSSDQLVLFPTPSDDPNDPLTWSTARKALNFTLVSFFVLWTFVQLDIGFTAWGLMQTELNFSIGVLNAGAAVNYGGLAIGCVFFIPLVHKYGRRPIYIFSVALQLASCVWQAKMSTVGGFIGSNLISGLGGAISEIVVQITVADLFFVHQHATMNGCFVIFQSAGAFLGPVASGYIVDSQGWRWMWWWCVIFFGVTLLCVVFLFEESKFVPIIHGQSVTQEPQTSQADLDKCRKDTKQANDDAVESNPGLPTRPPTINRNISMKPYKERMAWITVTPESMWPHLYQPIVTLFTFPAVAYAAITYGSTLAWFAIMTSLQASYMILPPWNFDAIGIGLMNLAPFVGAMLGFPVGGWLSDKHILWLSKRNGGIYEPEMRLWLALPVAILIPGSILMFGLGLAYGVQWSLLAVGFGLFGFAFSAISGIALSYLMDCYQDIIGNALVGVIFMRNIISVIVLFVLTPWVNGMGMQNLHILCAFVAFAIYLIPVPLLIWGKQARLWTAASYRKMAEKQVTHRAI
ncbi:Major facilitator superfamily domain general substrate transporter [Penicillium verhagenii]|nr:Major facilitator superfamily domain general substrate transporter [Penicillium verhagenii]